MFEQIHGKEIYYNNLLDNNAVVDLIDEYEDVTFAILKHNNACGLASRPTVLEAWTDALAGDPVSAFGGKLFFLLNHLRIQCHLMQLQHFHLCVQVQLPLNQYHLLWHSWQVQ